MSRFLLYFCRVEPEKTIIMQPVEKKQSGNPKLVEKKLANGNSSLYLEYYLGRVNVYDSSKDAVVSKVKRKRVALNLVLLGNPKNQQEKSANTDVLRLANAIRLKREQELLEKQEGYVFTNKQNINFLEYFQTYLDNYKLKDFRMIKIALSRLKDFMRDTPKYSIFSLTLKPKQLTHEMVEDFAEYLKTRSTGEGARSIFQRFKKVVRQAMRDHLFNSNPCEGIIIPEDERALKKEVLSKEEVAKLIDTHYPCESTTVRNAFIFCLYTGLRFCDVQELRYKNIDFANKRVHLDQKKVAGHSSKCNVDNPIINDALLQMIGQPQSGDPEEHVFDLPSSTSCNKSLKRWVARAGITKHITWHCARHTCGTLMANYGANIKTVSNFLGHSSLRHTEKYLHAFDNLKREGIENAMPKLGEGGEVV